VALDLDKFFKMFSPGDVIHWKEAIWTERPQFGQNRLAGEQDVTGRIISFAGKSASIEILAAEITDVRLPGSAQNELVPYETGKVVRKMVATLQKGNVAKTVAPEKKAPASLKIVAGYDRPGTKVGRNDPCPCGSNKKFKKCCEKKTAIEAADAAIKEIEEAIALIEQPLDQLKSMWPDYYRRCLDHFKSNPKWKDEPIHLDLIIVGFARLYAPWVIEADDEQFPKLKRKADAYWALMKEAVIASGTSSKEDVNKAFEMIRAGLYKELDKAR
jgi:hypothetical protein